MAQCRGLRFDPKPTTVTFKVEGGKILAPLLPIVRKIGYRHNQDYPIDMAEEQARVRAKTLAKDIPIVAPVTPGQWIIDSGNAFDIVSPSDLTAPQKNR